jgi:signal transduction histidine kinase
VQRFAEVPGIGLGLPISKGIVEAHGGRIWAANQAGQGAAFTIVLPILEGTE